MSDSGADIMWEHELWTSYDYSFIAFEHSHLLFVLIVTLGISPICFLMWRLICCFQKASDDEDASQSDQDASSDSSLRTKTKKKKKNWKKKKSKNNVSKAQSVEKDKMECNEVAEPYLDGKSKKNSALGSQQLVSHDGGSDLLVNDSKRHKKSSPLKLTASAKVEGKRGVKSENEDKVAEGSGAHAGVDLRNKMEAEAAGQCKVAITTKEKCGKEGDGKRHHLGRQVHSSPPAKLKKLDQEDEKEMQGSSFDSLANIEPEPSLEFGSRPRPLQNLGNTCFFNSVLQTLYQTRILGHLLKKFHTDVIQNDWQKCYLIQSVIEFYYGLIPCHERILEGVRKRSGRFLSYRQEDSHELLRHLCSGLMKEEQEVRGEGLETTVDSVFKGHILSSYLCLKCYHGNHLVEAFYDLSLAISFHPDYESDCTLDLNASITGNIKDEYSLVLHKLLQKNVNLSGGNKMSLEKCLEYFTKKEVTEYFCQRCIKENPSIVKEGALPPALSRALIVDLPPVLVIHLKRFEQTMCGYFKKCSIPVKYPMTLDMSHYCQLFNRGKHIGVGVTQTETHTNGKGNNSRSNKDKRKDKNKKNQKQRLLGGGICPSAVPYTLYGVVVHSGSMDCGHYVAYVKRRKDRTEELKNYISKKHFTKDQVTNEWLIEAMSELGDEQECLDVTENGKKEWYFISDSHVSQTTETNALNQEALLLFYEKFC